MARKSRIDAPGGIHHIIAKGIVRGKIFKDQQDRRLHISTAAVSQSVLRGEKLAKCHQYKLMNNFVK